MANGIERVTHALVQKRRWSSTKAAVSITIFLILFGLPKSLKPEERDKIAYRQAARIISEHKQAGQFALLVTARPHRAFEWVLLYAHRHDPVLRCSKSLIIDVPDDYEAFLHSLDAVNARYFFYEKRNWPKKAFDPMASVGQGDLHILGQWQHPDSGKLILLERLSH
jgi:hypothetical protein